MLSKILRQMLADGASAEQIVNVAEALFHTHEEKVAYQRELGKIRTRRHRASQKDILSRIKASWGLEGSA